MNLLNVILSAVLSGIMSYVAIINMSNEKFKLKNFIIYLIIFLPLLLVIYIFFSGISKLILNIILVIISLYFSLFKKDISNSVYYAIIYQMLVFISEIILSVLILFIFKLNGSEYSNVPFSLLISSILNCLLVYLLSRIKFISKNIRKLNHIIKKNNKDWIYIILIMILMVLFIFFNRYKMNNSTEYFVNTAMAIFVVV